MDQFDGGGSGDGTQATTEILFRSTVEDLAAIFDAELRWTADVVGEVEFEYCASDAEEDIASARWGPYVPASTVRGRYLQMRWRVTGDNTQVISLDHLCWSVHAPGATRKLLDRDTSDWEGTAADGREVPHDLSLVTDLDVTLQSVSAGWSWTLLNKNDPTLIRIYDGAGNPADAVVDVIVRGVAA